MNGNRMRGQVKDTKNGQMVQSTQEIGQAIKLMGLVNCITQMETYTKEIG